MKSHSFHAGWTWKHLGEPGPGAPVCLPHDAMLLEPRSPRSAGGVNTGWYEGRDYLYSKTFTPDEALARQTAVLEFEGVYHNAEVWLDGEKLTFRPYGYTNFYVDLTGRLKAGREARLEVIARNADQPNSRWYSGAGIYRPVTLWTAEREHIALNGVKIRTLCLSPAQIQVQVRTSGAGRVKLSVRDGARTMGRAEGDTKGQLTFTLTLSGARPWSVDTPHLYTCTVQFGTDEVTECFGLRTLEWGKKGLLLNGERVILRGACVHHDHGLLGACCYPDAEERRVRLLKENGYNALRSAHNPCSKALLNACDRLGLLVMDEYIDHWYIHKTEHDYVEYFPDWWRRDLADMVDKDFNHPCVVLYSTGNEVSETAQERGIRLTGELTEHLHGLDPTRPVTCGVNIFFNLLSSIGFGVYSDEKAKRESKRAEKARSAGVAPQKKRAVGSEFFNNLAGLLGDDFMKFGASLPPCDWKTRGAFANMDVAGYNYGINRYEHDLKQYPNRLILGSETFCCDAYRFWEAARREPRLIGDFVWAGMDYLGEVGVGSWEYADYAPDFSHGPGWVSAGSGRIDLTGRPLGEAFYTRVALEQAAGPFLAVCPVNHTGDRHSPSAWKMSNAIPSWSWNGCAGNAADVEVYARAASVELFVNGASVGKKKLKRDCIARFRCTYEDGTVEAAAYDAAGRETGRCSLHTAGTETELRAAPEAEAVRPGGLSYIRLQYTDRNGVLKPLARGILTVEVAGGRLLGLGSACPFNEIGYTTKRTDTYYGEALAIVQAGEGGEILLRVSDGSLSAAARVPVLADCS